MASFGLEILGITCGTLGWVLAVVACALPMWKVTAFIGYNILTAQVTWQGIWMTCVAQSTGHMQCKVYDSVLALSPDLQVARALTILSIVVAFGALLVALTGARCTNCMEGEAAKTHVLLASGAALLTASLVQLIPSSWTAHRIVADFYNPLVPKEHKQELGASLYLAWAAACLLFLGGSILCCSCPPDSEARYALPPARMPTSNDSRKDYV